MSTEKNIPKNNVSQSVNEPDFIERLQGVIVQQIANKNHQLPLLHLAKKMQIGEKTLSRKIKEHTQQTPQRYLQELRLQKAHQAIEKQQYTTTKELAYSFGYSNPSYFAAIFKKRFGYSPKRLIFKQKGHFYDKKTSSQKSKETTCFYFVWILGLLGKKNPYHAAKINSMLLLAIKY